MTEEKQPVVSALRKYSPRTITALKYRDYRLYWGGSFVSLLGTEMSRVANAWQVYRLTHSALMLGVTGLFSLVPMVFFALLGGVVADALDRRILMLLTQTLLLLSALVLAVTTYTGHITVWIIFGMAAVNGAVTAFNNPARSALIATLVPRNELGNAISLGTTNRLLASVMGPSIAGMVIGFFTRVGALDSIGLVYLIDTVSFAAVLVALMMMSARPGRIASNEVSLSAAVEGLKIVFRNPVIRSTTLLDFFATFCGSSEYLMPIFAFEILRTTPRGLGFLMAAPSIGAVSASIILAFRGVGKRQGAGVLWGVTIYGLAWVLFGLCHNIWIAVLALAATGAADAVSMVMRQTISQVISPNELRGRMTSVNMVFFMGGPRLGEFESGAVARFFSAPIAAIAGGVGVLLVTALIAGGVPELRRYTH